MNYDYSFFNQHYHFQERLVERLAELDPCNYIEYVIDDSWSLSGLFGWYEYHAAGIVWRLDELTSLEAMQKVVEEELELKPEKKRRATSAGSWRKNYGRSGLNIKRECDRVCCIFEKEVDFHESR